MTGALRQGGPLVRLGLDGWWVGGWVEAEAHLDQESEFLMGTHLYHHHHHSNCSEPK